MHGMSVDLNVNTIVPTLNWLYYTYLLWKGVKKYLKVMCLEFKMWFLKKSLAKNQIENSSLHSA